MDAFRWRAMVSYRAKAGVVTVMHDFEEFAELGDLIERGPDWNTITGISIELARCLTPGLTIEDADG